MNFQTALECLSSSNSRIKLSCSDLDLKIGPCLRSGQVIEVTGEAGSGKTQFALEVSVCSAKEKVGIVVYIQTEGEGPFPSSRLFEMLENVQNLENQVSDKIFVQAVRNSDELLYTLDRGMNLIAQRHGTIQLVVLDSVAGALRSETENFDRKSRSTLIHQIGYELNLAARRFNAPVLVLNQVTAFIDQAQESFGRNVVPCFGAFASYVHTRIFVQKVQDIPPKSTAGKNELPQIRSFEVDFSPMLPPIKVYFIVKASGISEAKLV